MSRFVSLFLLLWPLAVAGQHPPHPKLAQARAEFRLAQARHDTLAMADAAYLMGKRYRSSGEYVQSRRWLLYALNIWEPRGPSVKLNKVYVQLASDGPLSGGYPEAVGYAYRALANSRRLADAHCLMSAYGVLGGLYRHSAQQPQTPVRRQAAVTDSAARYFRQAEALALRLSQPLDVAVARWQQAQLLAVRSPQRAAPLYAYALNIYERTGAVDNVVELHNQIASNYVAMNGLDSARHHLARATQLRQMMPQGVTAHTVASLHYAWANYYHVAGNWQRAYTYLRLADSLRQATLTADQQITIAQLNAAYEANRRDRLLQQQRVELAQRESRLATQRHYTYAALALLAVAALLGTIYYRLYRTNRRISQQNAELLREQSHRMKNNFQAISGLLSLQSNRLIDVEAKRVVQESQLRVQTMALLNRKLYDTHELVALGLPTVVPEIVGMILHSYGYEAIQPTFHLDPVPVHISQAVPIALIVNELVTNACKYAFPNHPDPALQVRCWREAGRLRLWVRDNGLSPTDVPDLADNALPPSFGLRLIAIQAQQLWATFAFTAQSGADSGLVFNLSAPLKQ